MTNSLQVEQLAFWKEIQAKRREARPDGVFRVLDRATRANDIEAGQGWAQSETLGSGLENCLAPTCVRQCCLLEKYECMILGLIYA